MKNLCKSERSFKDMSVAAEEDCKNHEKMQALIDQTEGKVKAHRCWMSRVLDVWVLAGSPGCWISRKQIQEAEEIAALNLAKYSKVAGAFVDAVVGVGAERKQVLVFLRISPLEMSI